MMVSAGSGRFRIGEPDMRFSHCWFPPDVPRA
jgi:hypothetical protein